MRINVKESRLIAAALCFLFLAGFSGAAEAKDKRFKREEKFPRGEQTSAFIGNLFGGIKDVNVVSHVFDAPYAQTWAAVQKVARDFGKVGGRGIAATDHENGRIQNGRISQDALIGMGATAWKDEFVMEATEVAPNQTKVSIMRKVVEKQIKSRQWATVWSNGKIERWLLTQIEDALKSPGTVVPKSEEGPVVKKDPIFKALAGKYKGQYNTFDELELKPDGSFLMLMSGMESMGRFDVEDGYITLHIEKYGGHALSGYKQKARIKDGTLAGIWGQVWTPEAAETPAQGESPEVLTTADIVRMVEASLSELAILAKIRASTCKCDTSTDALIKLKQAGVSDSVIQAMAEAAAKK